MASNYPCGYDDERFESIVDQHFHCLICYNVLKDPVMCRSNQHYFCSGCITEHLRRNSHTCPTCADELTVETLQDVPRIVKDYLNERKIRCDHYGRGCRELLQLQNLQRHVAECGFSPVVCGNQGCGETISKRDRTYHESELCQFRKLKCHNCGEISTMMAGMETKIANLDTKMANINTNQANTGTKLANTNTNMANIRTEIEDVKTKMANIDTKMTKTDTKLDNMHTKMAMTDTKLENINTKMANLQANLEAKFEAVNNEVRGIRMSLNEVKDGLKVAVLEKIESKERKQEEITRHVSRTASGGRKNQHIFVAGSMTVNSVEIFNYPQRLWSLLNPMPVNLGSATSFVYNNHVTVAGGWCSDGASVDNMIRMNIQTVPDLSINWSDFAPKLPARLYAHSGVVHRDSLFLTGGYNADQHLHSDCIHEIQLQPPYTIKLLSKLPEPRILHNTVLCDDSILIIGGRKSWEYKDNLSSVLRYDINRMNVNSYQLFRTQ